MGGVTVGGTRHHCVPVVNPHIVLSQGDHTVYLQIALNLLLAGGDNPLRLVLHALPPSLLLLPYPAGDFYPAWKHEQTGHNLTETDMVDYLRFLSKEVHARDMGWGLLNSQMVSKGRGERAQGRRVVCRCEGSIL
jgi:hypothetical protein